MIIVRNLSSQPQPVVDSRPEGREIPQEIAQLEECVGLLHNSVECLAKRLEPILVIPAPPPENPSSDEPRGSTLAVRLVAIRRQIDKVLSNIRALDNYVQL